MRRDRSEALEIPLSSLIDVVFLLIIFFVVTTNMEKDVVDRQVQLAKSYYIPPLTEAPPPQAMTINVVMGRGGDIYYTVAGNRLTLSSIEYLLRDAKNRFGKEVPVILRSDRRVQYREIQKLNNVVGKAGLYRVSHAARDSSDEPR